MSLEDYRPRMTVELTEAQKSYLDKVLPHGMKKQLFQVLVEGIICLHKSGGHEAIGALISRHISITQLADFGTRCYRDQNLSELESLTAKLRSR